MRLPAVGTLLVTSAIGLAAMVSIGGGATFVALEVTTQPEFCTSCHIMEPYYESWKHSSHGNVSCVDCHYEPGLLETFEGKFKALSQLAKYATQTQGSKPWAEVADESCMRSGCHNTRLLEGELRFGNVRFDHRHHLVGLRRGKKLRCTSCHSQIVQGDHLTVTTSSCFLCHFKHSEGSEPIDDCGKCHGPPTEAIALGDGFAFEHADYLARGVGCADCHGDITRGVGEVPKERCGSCHNKQEHLERIDDVEFMHGNHVTDHSVTCLDCHLEIQHGLPPREEHYQGDCTGCHEDTHGVSADLYRGTGGRGVEDRPGVMYMARVTCNGCHRPPFEDAPEMTGVTFEADPLACIDCHGPGYETMTEAWQDEVSADVAEVREAVEDLHARLAAAPAGARAHYEDAAYNLGLVLADKSGGAHNLPYVRDLLARAAADAHAGLALVDPEAERSPLEVGPRAVSEDGCTTLCHVAPEALPPLEALGNTFEHAPHVVQAGLQCNECHSVEPHGRTQLAAEDCNACHHADEDSDTCVSCHEDTVGLRAQEIEGLDLAPMADLDCMDCHLSLEGDLHETLTVACGLCHPDEGLTVEDLVAAGEAPLQLLETRLVDAPSDTAATIRAALDRLRRAGPVHNTVAVQAEIDRLSDLFGPEPESEPPTAPVQAIPVPPEDTP
ncbi:MAG: NapC/NirT family cytochrome c [Planctomycetota bacterium]|jgi:nitrate/TMAO reductase-like tetraheme cytochrome c subunit